MQVEALRPARDNRRRGDRRRRRGHPLAEETPPRPRRGSRGRGATGSHIILLPNWRCRARQVPAAGVRGGQAALEPVSLGIPYQQPALVHCAGHQIHVLPSGGEGLPHWTPGSTPVAALRLQLAVGIVVLDGCSGSGRRATLRLTSGGRICLRTPPLGSSSRDAGGSEVSQVSGLGDGGKMTSFPGSVPLGVSLAAAARHPGWARIQRGAVSWCLAAILACRGISRPLPGGKP